MGWLIAVGVLILLAIIPLGISLRYDSGGAVVKLIVSVFQFTLHPCVKSKKHTDADNEPKKKKSRKRAVGTASEENTSSQTGGSWKDFLPLVHLMMDFLGSLRRKIRVKQLEMKLIMAADDPCDLGVNYGRAWAAVGNLMPQLERLFVIKKRDIQVECDFMAIDTLVVARMDITITLGRLIVLVATYGIKAFVEFLKIKNKRKGGADQ